MGEQRGLRNSLEIELPAGKCPGFRFGGLWFWAFSILGFTVFRVRVFRISWFSGLGFLGLRVEVGA